MLKCQKEVQYALANLGHNTCIYGPKDMLSFGSCFGNLTTLLIQLQLNVAGTANNEMAFAS